MGRALVPLTSVMAHFHTASNHRRLTKNAINKNLRAPDLPETSVGTFQA